MSKTTKAQPNYTPESLGFSGLNSSPIVQQSMATEADAAADSMFPYQSVGKAGRTSLDFKPEDLQYVLDHNGQLNGSDKDIEHSLAQAQGFWGGLGRSIDRFVPMTALKLAETITNLGAGVSYLAGNKDAFDSHGAWNEYLENTANELKNAFPIYGSERYDNDNLAKHIFSSKFWTDDVSDGLSFILAQAIGTKGLGLAAKGAGTGLGAIAKAANLGELYNAVPITQRIASAVANKFTTGTVGFLNAASISAMQAKGTGNQIEAKLRQKYSNQINPDTGNYYTPEETDNQIAKQRDLIDEKTNSTFWATMATELLPSIYASKLFLGSDKANMGQLNTDIMKAVNKGKITLEDIERGVTPEVLKKAGLYKGGLNYTAKEAGKAALVGGVAMNFQSAIQKYDVDQAMAGHRGDIWSNSLGYASQFLDNLTDSEQVKGVVMGAILGGLTGAFHARSNAKEYNEAMTGHLDSMRASDALFGDLPKTIYKTNPNNPDELVLDKDGKPIEDTEKLTKLTFQLIHDKNNWDNQTAAMLSANGDMATLNEHVALAQMIGRELQSGRYDSSDGAREFFKWFHGQRIKEQGLQAAKEQQDTQVSEAAKNLSPDAQQGDGAAIETTTAMKTGSAQGDARISNMVNENSRLIDTMFSLWDTTGKQAAKLTRLGENNSRLEFNDNIRRGLFYEAVKREAYKKMILDREAEMREIGSNHEELNRQSEIIGNLITDSENRSGAFINDKELYNEWLKSRANRYDLVNNTVQASEKYQKSKSPEDQRAASTADYILQEHAAKEGFNINTNTADTDMFLTSSGTQDRVDTPIGLRNEQQFKAGLDYMKMSRLRNLIDSARTGEGSPEEAVNYATDNITRIDDGTKAQLQQMLSDENTRIAHDEERLATMPDFDEDTMQVNPEYAELEYSIKERKDSLDKAQATLNKAVRTQELDQINRQPGKIEETLNKQFAEKQFDRANNVIANAIDEDGSVKDSYTDSNSVASAMNQVRKMRNAMEDRLDSGDLKGQEQYRYLINKADRVLDKLLQISNAVEDNKIRRDGMQRAIANREARHVALALGFDTTNGTVHNPEIFRAADSILGGKLKDMLAQVDKIQDKYAGMMSILHGLKTKGTQENLTNLSEQIEDRLDSLANSLPESNSNKFLRGDMSRAPELYLPDLLQSMYKPGSGYEELSLDKGSPISEFKRTNDIDALESRIENMPEDTRALPISKADFLNTVRTYREMVALNRTKNLLNSKLNLLENTTNEIKTAGDSNGIVPTAQQEIAIRDGLAWLSSNKPVSEKPFSGWGFLRGIAGTGKTSVTVKWLLGLSDIKPEEIIASAATDKAAGVLGSAINTEAVNIDNIGSLNGKKLIVLDEYARIPTERLNEFEQKVREHNKSVSPADRIKVMILGDPTQITPLIFANQDITRPTSNRNARNISVINPLTVVYRSDVSAVNEASDLFQDNSNLVRSINVRADKDINSPWATGVHTSKSAADIADIIRRNQQYEKTNGLKPRSRVIITEEPAKYAGIPEVNAISVYDAQSETYDEVYVDLKPTAFYDTEKYNTAMYTAASRARQYAYLRYDEGTNTTDPGLSREKENNDQVARDAKGEYIRQRTEEQAMMEAAAKGKPIDVPKQDVATKVQQNEPPLERAIEPDTPEDMEIVAEVPSAPSDQVLPTEPEPEGYLDPETEEETTPSEPIYAAELGENERLLSNIKKGTFEALGGRRQEQLIDIGSKTVEMYTYEPNGENSITTFSFDKDGNWIPVATLFQEEINKHPQYKQWKDRVAGMQPMNPDPQRLNAVGGRAAVSLEDMAAHKVDEGTISRHQRLTYVFGNEPVQVGVANHIKNIFKSKFFSPKPSEQAKADKLVFRIFRNNELDSHKFGGFKPDAGIPYAVIGAEPNTRDWSNAQFVRLTANRLSQESDHYRVLRGYRDTAKEIEAATGVTPGTKEYNRVIRALKNSLRIEHEETPEGTEPRVRMKTDYERADFLNDLRRVTPRDEDVVDPLAHLTDLKFEQLLPKMQELASMIYGINQGKAELTPSELEREYGSDYEHLPLKSGEKRTITKEDGSTVEEPLGRARLKGTGPNTGKKDVYIPSWELRPEKGIAQQAFNQLAKANEYAGNIRIRVDDMKNDSRGVARASRPTGKSLITEKGGDAQVYYARKVLSRILGEIHIDEGKLDRLDLDRKETRSALDSDIRKMAGEQELDAAGLGRKLLEESNLSAEQQANLLNQLNEALNKKETPPVTMRTLDMMVGDNNYEGGAHLTEEAYHVTNPKSGRTKEVRTYLRTPLDIDHFNELGKAPELNEDELSKMVGTKFRDILPTQIAVKRSGEPIQKVAEEPIKQTTTAPGSQREIQDKIDNISVQLATMKPGREKMELTRQMRKLIDERDNTSRLFNETQRGDKGRKITIEEATKQVRAMLPNLSDNEVNFLNKSLMIELQRPGESLLGLFQKGKLYFQEDEGTVYENVVRHEVFHKVFNDYLNDRERQVISNEFDPQGKMSPEELEESLADKFMEWQKQPETFTGKIKRIFQRILQWIGLARSGGSFIDQLFNDIHDGKFQRPDPDTANTRRAFSDIRKWGTVQDYKDASRYLQEKIFQNLIDEHIDNMPLTQSELFDTLKQNLKDTFNEENALADSYVEALDYLTGEYNAASTPAEKAEIQAEMNVYNNELIDTNQKLKMLHTFVNDERALKDMWKDLYPNFSFKKQGIVSLTEDDPQRDDPESLEKTESEQDKEDGSIRSDFILNSDEKNQETKISQNVKNFLSFIYRPATTGRNAKGSSRINPRGVYLLSLRTLAGMQTGEADFIQQVQQRAKENGINLSGNSDASLVVNHLVNLYHNASGDSYEFNQGRNEKGLAKRYEVKLPLNARFLDENTFVMDLSGKDISGITQFNDNHFTVSRNGRSTADFLQDLTSSGITMDQAKGYFRQFQAQETLRELMSNFTSQREATPMIAEEVNDFGNIQLRYFRAQAHGVERVQTTEIENSIKENWDKAILNGWDTFSKAKPQDKNRAIADLLKHFGIDGEGIRNSESSLVNAVYGDLQAFKNVVDSTAAEAKKVVSENASDSDESVAPADPVALALEKNTGMLDRLTRLITRNSSDERASSYMDVKGTKRYLYHNGSQAHDTIGKIMRFFGDKIGSLPDHLTKDTILSKNIFASGENRIMEILDHDGMRKEGREEFASSYNEETNKQWLERNFSYGFLNFLKTNSRDNADSLTYMQNFYTISNRPRMLGARVEILSEPRIERALLKAIEQHVEQPDLKEVKNYDRFKAVNFDEFHSAIKNLHDMDVASLAKHTEGRTQLANLYDRIAGSEEMKSELAKDIIRQLKEHAGLAMQRMKQESVQLSSDANEAMRLLKDKRRQVLPDEAEIAESSLNDWPADEQMLPTVESFYMNNYVNSFFLNQAVAGNMNYFKDALDMVKRMSGVFAPGVKGIVGNRFFLKQKFNVAVAKDPKMKAEYLSPVFKDTKLLEAVGKKPFDMADAQGFMLPERAANIVQGFGKNYNAGAVFKPAHYEVAERTLEDGTKAHIPVMLKYSSVVLSDDLVSRFPKLEALRSEMRSKQVDEFIFDSGTKVGAPAEQTVLPSAVDYSDNRINIDPKSIVALSNENYRLQLNPSSDAYAKVANPTQLGYFLNVMHKLTKGGELNLKNADAVYSAIGEKISRGIVRLADKALDADGKFKASVIKNSLTGPGNERLQEMLANGLSYNMPNIADKALIQIANTVDKETVKIKFPGGKMVLQSSYGMDIPDGNGGMRRLEYRQDEKGRWYAEILLPKVYMDKAKPGSFLLPDGMGFRIPSTELHSSVPFKVVGHYDDKGSNVVVAPAELVAQHGSDFDVDSLPVITRELAKQDIETYNHKFEKDTPVGYYPNGDKLEFNPVRFRNELEEAKLEAAGNKKLLGQIEELHDQFLTNQVTESFLDTISHPDNKDRMLTPISTDVIQESLDKLGISGDKAVNLSRLLDNLKVYNSNFQGASLVGIFANGMKALSYISRAGEGGNYPELNKELAVEWNGKTYDSFTEQDHTGGNLWEQLDALVNTSVDNVKEQKLYLMNATDRTGPVYVAAKAMGMPLEETIRMMKQPIIKLFSETPGGKQTAISNLKKAIVQHAIGLEVISDGQNYSELRKALEDKLPELTEKSLDARLKSSSLGETPEELAHQVAVLDQFEKINKVGQDLTTFSSAISILQNMPVFYEDIARKVEQWDSLGSITDGKLSTSSDFSFKMDNLLQAQPNIAEAYKAFQFMKEATDKSLIKHFPEVKALADDMAGSMKIRLVGDNYANKEKIKNEIVSYLLSSYYSDELRDQKAVEVDRRKGGKTILTGKQAWSQDFAGQMETYIKENKKDNPFLRRLSVKKDNYGIKTLQFSNSSNPDAEEALEMQEGFSAIQDQSIKNGLLKYGVLNFGLNFGQRNYSMFIPSELLKPVSDFISKDIKSMVAGSTLDSEGKLIAGPLKNIRDNLAIRMAVNNPDKLPYISAKRIPPVQTLDESGNPKFVEIDGNKIPVLSGMDDKYFWHRAYDNPVKGESGKLTYGENELPEFIKQRDGNGRDVVYRRLNDPTVDEKVYYQRVGYKNYTGGYDASKETIRSGYNPDEYFAKQTIPVPVADIRANEFEVRNDLIAEGRRVAVYPYSNATRELGLTGIVDKVRTGLDGETKLFTLKRDIPDAPREIQHLMDIAHNVTSRFGLKLNSSEELPQGVKAKYENGVVTLNEKLITPDTAFHEVSHPLVAAIQKQNPTWYRNLSEELHSSPEGRAIYRRVENKYPELSKEGKETEALVTAIGQKAANQLPESNFSRLVSRLMRSVGNLVRGVINEIRGKGGLSLESLAAEDMAKLTIGDIADILAAKEIKLNLDLSKVQDEPQYSKDLGDEKPEQGSTMEALLAKQDSIQDPATDENGQEGDSYTYKGKELSRVSRLMDKFTFRERKEMLGPDGKPMTTEMAIAKREADRMFRNTQPGEKLIIDGVEQTRQEYQDAKLKMLRQGIAKGQIIHAKLQRYEAVLNGNTAKVLELDHKIEELSSQADKLPSAYDWVTRKGVYSKLMENAGINIGSKVPKGREDKIYSEVKIASPLLGAGKIDRIVERPDGRLRIVDWKTGSRLRDKYSSTILKYGVQENRITDNPLDRAKLQTMMYALMVKAEHPEAKFDGLVVMHLPNEFEATRPRNALAVEIPDYLRMLEQYYRHEEPDTYAKLIQQSPRIFDPREYNAPKSSNFSQDVINSQGASEPENLQKLQLDLQKVVVEVEMRRAENASENATREQRELMQNLVRKIQEGHSYVPVDISGGLDSDYEISILSKWLSDRNDTHNPYLQSFAQHYATNREKADKQIADNFRKFDKLLQDMMDEKLGKRNKLQKALTWVDKKKLFSNLFHEVRAKDPDGGPDYLKRTLVTDKDTDHWNRLSAKEKAFVNFMHDNMESVFKDVMVSGDLAVVGRNEKDQPITKLDLYNQSRKGANFKYERGFFPRLAITRDEVNQRLAEQFGKKGFSALSDYAKDTYLRYITDFFENNMEGYNQKDYGLPVRFLGNVNTYASPDTYSLDLESGYKRFMEQMIRKKHLDSTWMYGQAVKGILENINDANGNAAFKQSTGFLDYQMKNILTGDVFKGNGKLTRQGFAVKRTDGKEYTVSTLKTYRTLKGALAASTLWLKPTASFVNAAQASYMVAKESLVNTIGKKFAGVRAEEADLSYGNHLTSYKDAIGSQLNIARGNGKTDFVHQLAKELRLYSDMDEAGGKAKEYITKSAALLDTHHFGFMYSVPEDVTNVMYGLNYLKTLKVQSGKYKGTSMFDIYKNSFDAKTGTFNLPADFIRGKIEKPDGTFEDLRGIHVKEMEMIHQGIKRIKGGYRPDEKTAIQGTILGDMLMMFKRWIPAMAVQQYKSKYTNPAIGQFELDKIGDSLRQKDGEPVYQWRARVVEGRMRTVANLVLHGLHISKQDGYAWSDLTSEQRKSVIDFGISLGTWMSMLGFGSFAFGDRKEKDTIRQLSENLTGRFFEQWSGLTMLDQAIQSPAVLKRFSDTAHAFGTLVTAGAHAATGGENKDIYTERGDIRGMKMLEKNLPFLAGLEEVTKFEEDTDKDSIWDNTSGY